MTTFCKLSCLALLSTVALLGQNKNLPVVRLIATGGTIAHVREGFTPDTRINGAQLLKDIPQLGQYAQMEVEEFSKIGSGDFSTKMLVDLANRVNQVFTKEPRVAAVVVSIGSNALEEVAYFLDLTVKSDKPVVLTAAQRLHGTLGADGDENLVQSVRVAVSPQSRSMGVLAVVNDEIHAARDVRKTISHRVDAWNSGDLGDLGLVDKDRVNFYRRTLRKHTTQAEFDVSGLTDLPKVYVLYSYVGADSVLVDAAVKEGKAKGIVLGAFPTGTGAPEQAQALLKVAATGVPVVDSHRGGRGRPSNRYPEFVDADNLPPPQARILLMLALTKTSDRKEIQRMFDDY
ncbi:MAG TPA: asparaginase [Bryobacteraceae bacterium]|nr:asparaginase [Bryobacteraceae bacterium]